MCEGCRKRVWGPGTGIKVWAAWEKSEGIRARKRVEETEEEAGGKGKGKSALVEGEDVEEGGAAKVGPLVVFACRHVWHQGCLEKAGGGEGGDEGDVKGTGESAATDGENAGRSGGGRFRCPLCV